MEDENQNEITFAFIILTF